MLLNMTDLSRKEKAEILEWKRRKRIAISFRSIGTCSSDYSSREAARNRGLPKSDEFYKRIR